MKTLFVDADIFLRFFTTDDEGQHRKAASLFKEASMGRCRLVTGPPVLFEIAWTLRSAYNLANPKILDVMQRLLALPGLRMTDAEMVEEAVAVAKRTGQEFADAYIHSLGVREQVDAVATFNRKHFEKTGTPLHEL
jgi:predicted nucleic acid-binding protein